MLRGKEKAMGKQKISRKKPFRILSIDGGGIRGIYPAKFLQGLAEKEPGFLESVDLYAGTSTGAIIAAGLAFGMTPTELVDLYTNRAKEIFKDSPLDNILDVNLIKRFGNLPLLGAQYNNTNLKRILTEIFGNRTLGDLNPKKILISSFDLKYPDEEVPGSGVKPRWKPKFFHNYVELNEDGVDVGDSGQGIVDVLMRSSAAPIYFPVFDGYVDGGVVANNPSLAAVAQALDKGTGKMKLTQIRLLSLGTGQYHEKLEAKDDDWGLVSWGPNIVGLMFDGQIGVADYQCRKLLGERYRRVMPVMDKAIGLGEISRIPEMVAYDFRTDRKEISKWLHRKKFIESKDQDY